VSRYVDMLRMRLRSLFGSAGADRELARELRAHLDEEIDANLAAGMTPAEARSAAVRAFGAVAPIEERCRDARRVQRLQNLTRDVRYAVRTLGRQPGLVAAAALSMALGVGANLTIFSLANSLLLATPSASAPDELVFIRTGNGSHVSFPVWRQLNESGALAGVAGYRFEQSLNWRNGDESRTLVPLLVTANFFDVLGVPVERGRGFTAGEAQAERQPRLVVVSHGFWERRLARDPDVIGGAIVLNGVPYTIIGVLAANHRCICGYGFAPELYLPLSRDLVRGLDNPRSAAAQLVGRLRAGQSLAAGRAAIEVVAARLAAETGDREVAAIPVFAPVGGLAQTSEMKAVGVFFLVLLVVSGLVLVIACANVAGLLLAHGLSRRREMALRLALGASRGRLVQQLLAESLVLSAIGAVAGSIVTAAAFVLLSRVSLPLPLPVELQFAFDARVVAVAIGLVLASTLATGLAPALQATKTSLLPAIKHDERRVIVMRRRVTLGSLLVGGQVAVALVVLVTALLFVRSLMLAAAVDPGFEVDRVLVAQISFVEGRQGSADRLSVEGMIDRIRENFGVRAAAFADSVPLTIYGGSRTGTRLRVEGQPEPVRVDFDSSRVGPGYFETLGIRLLRGRDFTIADRARVPEPIVINEEFARRYFPGLDPIGRRVSDPARRGSEQEVVGVVANGKYRSLAEDQDAAIFEPILNGRTPNRLVHVLVRTTGQPDALGSSVRAAVLALDGTAAVGVTPMRQALAFAVLPSQMGSAILGTLGALGTLLAMVGLFGIVSFAVSRRTAEIAIRMALGASRQDVVRLVLADAGRLIAGGLAAGLALAWLITGPLSAFLVAGVSPSDGVSFLGAASVLTLACLGAVWAPCRRAIRIAPAAALKME
jgi:putative ABC transport system permease protein